MVSFSLSLIQHVCLSDLASILMVIEELSGNFLSFFFLFFLKRRSNRLSDLPVVIKIGDCREDRTKECRF